MIVEPTQVSLLQAKYAELCAKCEGLVTKFGHRPRPRQEKAMLAWSLLRTSSMALAMFDDTGIVVASRGFRKLVASARRQSPWRVARENGRAARWSGGLVELLAREARRLLERRRRRERTLRIESAGQGRWFDALFECNRSDCEWRVTVFLHDVTAQVAADRRHLQMQEATQRHEPLLQMGVLAAGVAHDLKNVLHAISLRVDDRAPSPVSMAALRRLVTQGAQMLSRVQEFAQRRERAGRAIDLYTVVRESIDLVQTTVRSRALEGGVTIFIESRLSPVPRVVADAVELRRVFVNLILNAADAMPSGGRIEIRTEDQGGLVVASVADEGQGIRQADLKHIFEPFFSTKGEKGTGLGLSIARDVVERFGGTIGAANRERGGAVFTVSLPKVAEENVGATPLAA